MELFHRKIYVRETANQKREKKINAEKSRVGWKSSGWMVVAFSASIRWRAWREKRRRQFRDKLRFQPSHQEREKFGSGSNYRHRHRWHSVSSARRKRAIPWELSRPRSNGSSHLGHEFIILAAQSRRLQLHLKACINFSSGAARRRFKIHQV